MSYTGAPGKSTAKIQPVGYMATHVPWYQISLFWGKGLANSLRNMWVFGPCILRVLPHPPSLYSQGTPPILLPHSKLYDSTLTLTLTCHFGFEKITEWFIALENEAYDIYPCSFPHEGLSSLHIYGKPFLTVSHVHSRKKSSRSPLAPEKLVGKEAH